MEVIVHQGSWCVCPGRKSQGIPSQPSLAHILTTPATEPLGTWKRTGTVTGKNVPNHLAGPIPSLFPGLLEDCTTPLTPLSHPQLLEGFSIVFRVLSLLP